MTASFRIVSDRIEAISDSCGKKTSKEVTPRARISSRALPVSFSFDSHRISPVRVSTMSVMARAPSSSSGSTGTRSAPAFSSAATTEAVSFLPFATRTSLPFLSVTSARGRCPTSPGDVFQNSFLASTTMVSER